MTSRDFIYWLQGYFEISKADSLDAAKVAAIKKHLALVFKHEIDPSMGDDEHQKKLDHLHQIDNGPTVYRC